MLAEAERRITSLETQIRQADAQGEAARAHLDAANVNLGSTIVRASVDGRVGDRGVRVGQYVTSGTRTMSVVPLRALYITSDSMETQVGLMRPGQSVSITVDALPGVALGGRVESVSQFPILPPQNAISNFTKIVQRYPYVSPSTPGPKPAACWCRGFRWTSTFIRTRPRATSAGRSRNARAGSRSAEMRLPASISRALPCAPFLLFSLLGGYTVGPNYAGPPIAEPDADKAPAFARADANQTNPQPPIARWWEALGDATLSALEVLAITANPDLAAAEAQLKQARAALRQEKASLLPNGKTLAVNAHARTPGLYLGDSGSGGGAPTISISTISPSIPAGGGDIFGGQRRAIEAARSTAQATQADIADARVTLTAEVERAYVNVRDRQCGIALNQQSIVMQTQIVELTKERYAHGTASCLDVERLCRDLDRTHADATPARRRARRLS
jgi:hypothetical protein